MSAFESDPILELEELLDPTRLATAWQVAGERPPTAAGAGMATPAPGAIAAGGSGAPGTAGPDDAAGTATAAEAAGAPALTAPLPVALAHRQLLDELERTLAASPGLAAKAGRVLAVPLARLAAVIDPDPLDLGAAEVVIDDLEDVLQALLSAAGWPVSGEE
jgi:hypothetical protein